MEAQRIALYWENIDAASKPMYEQLDAKLVEVGVYLWNNAPQYSSRIVRAYLAHYGTVPVVVTLYLKIGVAMPYVKVWTLPNLREIIYVGFERGESVAKFQLLGR